MDQDKMLREHLIALMDEGYAHMMLDDAVKKFPQERINDIFPNGQYSAWGLLEHIRLTQWDILDFIRNSGYKDRKWPNDYWPKKGKKATKKDWDNTIAQIKKDHNELRKIVKDPKTDLYAKLLPQGTGQTTLREILVVSDHNSYHLGEFGIMRQVMGTWYEGHDD